MSLCYFFSQLSINMIGITFRHFNHRQRTLQYLTVRSIVSWFGIHIIHFNLIIISNDNIILNYIVFCTFLEH